jgi:hypothetical protein
MRTQILLLAIVAWLPTLAPAAVAQRSGSAAKPTIIVTDLLLSEAARDSAANLLSLHLAQALTDWTIVSASTFERMEREFVYRDHRAALSVIDLREMARLFRADAVLVPVSAGGFRLVLQRPRQSTDTQTIYQSPHRPNQAALRTAADSVAKIAHQWVR